MKHKTRKRQASAAPPPEMETPPPAWRIWISRHAVPCALLGIAVLGLLVFRSVLVPGRILFMTDDNIGAMALSKTLGMSLSGMLWNDSVLLGLPQASHIIWTPILLAISPLRFFANWGHAITLIASSAFLMLFLRERKLGWPAVWVGILAAFWVGSNLTLVYAGHRGKFGALMFAALYLWLVERSSRRSSWPLAVLAGGALGAMFLEQADIALFIALALGPYTIYACIRDRGWNAPALLKITAPVLLTAFLFAAHPLWMGYSTAVKDVGTGIKEDPVEQWNFITQWSWPPEESIDFIAPGFTGWRSGDPAGPYVGRMGRSAGWEQTQQGFRNFKLENQYLGAAPVILAILGMVIGWKRRRSGERDAWDLLFWGGVVLVTLLLAFGRHFPLYRLFYMLPVVSSVRNPNKFLQVFQLSLAVLAAIGVQNLHDLWKENKWSDHVQAWIRPFTLGVAVVGAVLGVWGLLLMSSWNAAVQRFAQDGWGHLAERIVSNRTWALLYGAGMILLVACFLYRVALRRKPAATSSWMLFWFPVALMLCDVFYLSRFYVQTMPVHAVAENEVVQRVRADAQNQRVAMVVQDGFYNQWLTYLFPYHGIQALNITQMPRMPDDYRSYLNQVGQNIPRFWQLGAVGRIMGPAPLWGQISNDPQLREQYELAFAYNVDPMEAGARVVVASEQRPGNHVILRPRIPSPRHALVSGWRAAEDADALRLLASPDNPPFSQVLIAPDHMDGLSDTPPGSVIGSVDAVDYRAGYFRLRVSCETSAMLRVAEKYDPNWKATINGRPATVRRVDYIAMGVRVEPGVHEVILRYAPRATSIWAQVAGVIACVVALVRMRRQPQ